MRLSVLTVSLALILGLTACGPTQAQRDEWQTATFEASAAKSRLPVRRGPEFARPVIALVGDRRGDYQHPEQDLAYAIIDAFDGWSGEDVALADGAVLVKGCHRRDCRVRGALILDRTGAMRAAGLLHFACFDTSSLHDPNQEVACNNDPSLTLVLPADAPAAWREAIETWANPPVEVFPPAN